MQKTTFFTRKKVVFLLLFSESAKMFSQKAFLFCLSAFEIYWVKFACITFFFTNFAF